MKTAAEVEALKLEWLYDRAWDIEETEGFEEYRVELLAYRQQVERDVAEVTARDLADYAAAIGCADNLALAEFCRSLEDRLEKAHARLDALADRGIF